MNFWSIIWSVFWTFALISYLFSMFAVISDIFRDHKLAGGYKALWIIALVFVPFVTVLIYLIARGTSMSERSVAASASARSEVNDYIRSVAGASPADEIAKAKTLLDSDAITPAEFAALKAKSLATA
jgi:hypothetical protein